MIAQVFPFEAFDSSITSEFGVRCSAFGVRVTLSFIPAPRAAGLLVSVHLEVKRALHDLVRQDTVFQRRSGTAFFPLVVSPWRTAMPRIRLSIQCLGYPFFS